LVIETPKETNMKAALFAAGLTLVLAGPVQASWAENARMRSPVYTGTNRSLAHAQHAGRRHRHVVRHSVKRGPSTVGMTYR